jgi:K+-sensing histidine kinase KdpD
MNSWQRDRRSPVTLQRPRITDQLAHCRPAPLPEPVTVAWFGPASVVAGDRPAPEADRSQRRQISHDINHELGTIMLLASILTNAPDVGADSRQRARLILGETRWLDQLHRAYEDAVDHNGRWHQTSDPIRLDVLAEEIVAAMRLSTTVKIALSTEAVLAHADRLTFWRSLRNVIDNAIRAVGPKGNVAVTIAEQDGWAVAQVDDDGPGFEAAPAVRLSGGIPRAPLGLAIVQEMVSSYGGLLEIGTGDLGGSRVRMQVPAASC